MHHERPKPCILLEQGCQSGIYFGNLIVMNRR
jgi:hypothetical protein